MEFVFHNPTRVFFGSGMISILGAELQKRGAKKVLMVAGGGSIRKNSTYDQVVASLKESGINWVEAWGVQPNPTLEKVREIIALAHKEQVDSVLAVGGGSVIDSGKAIAAGFYLDDIWKAVTGEERITKALPVYTVLTLSATGSEMNGNAVITNSETMSKSGFGSHLLYPVFSIIDPTLQASLPFRQTVSGALDAIAHILEYYFAEEDAIATNAINTALIKTIMDMTDRLQENAADMVARANLAWCATLALNGISGAGHKGGDWACHGIEHAFSALKPQIAHGEGLGVIFPAWIEYMNQKMPGRFSGWAKDVWDEDNVCRALHKFREKITAWGAPTSLRELGLQAEDLPVLLELITASGTLGGFSKLESADIEALLMLAY